MNDTVINLRSKVRFKILELFLKGLDCIGQDEIWSLVSDGKDKKLYNVMSYF
jgi:hypothetical protein